MLIDKNYQALFKEKYGNPMLRQFYKLACFLLYLKVESQIKN